MSKAEDFIRDYTSHCSNELVGGGYHEWLTPEQAMRAVEIGREELIEKAVKWLKDNAHIFGYAECTDAFDAHYIYDADKLVENFKQAMSEQ